jgi:regulator of sigma E protease
MYTLIGSIFVFMLVIMLHELGHYTVAKLAGIKVNEFSIGMGPKIFQKQGKETKYSIRALPLGGYVALEGESEDSEDPRSFGNVSVYKRMAVVVAGVIMNLILAIITFMIIASIIGVPSDSNVIGSVKKDTPAYEAGLLKGDRIVKVDDVDVNSWSEVVENISNKEAGKQINITIKRDGKDLNKKITPIKIEGQTAIGIGFSKSPQSIIKYGFVKTYDVIVEVFVVLGGLFTGKYGVSMLSGPVGVISVIGQATSAGIINLLFILALISANLAVVNILPIPALDGGKLLFLIIEAISGHKVNEKVESILSFIGIVLLFTLVGYVTIFGDLARLGV